MTKGWLDGKLRRPEKPAAVVDLRRVRYERVLVRLKTWETKRKRASTAIKKLEQARKRYEKTLQAA